MKGALVVGIDNYPAAPLKGSVNDAKALASLLKTNEDGTKNFEVELLTDVQTKISLKAMIDRLFKANLNTALFYFSGHGSLNGRGGFIVTPDFRNYDEGVSMDEVLTMVNNSSIQNKIIIIDCCHAGAAGIPEITGGTKAYLAEGIIILTASRKSELSWEVNGHGVFTSLLLDALRGGAADIAGNITPGSVYAYIDQSLGFLEQRPQFRSNVSRFISLRNVQPRIPLEAVLGRITEYFKTPETKFPLDRTYEDTNPEAIAEHVAIFKHLQKMQSVGLVEPVDEQFMFFAAQNKKSCRLTSLGMHYWKLVDKKII